MEYKNLFGGNDKMKKVGGYPSPYVSPKQKEKKEYGLAYFKRMYYDWKDNSEINIDSRRALYTKARSYAQGAQDTRKYKDLLDVEGDTSYLNLDWTPVNIIPKFVATKKESPKFIKFVKKYNNRGFLSKEIK